MLNDGHDTTVDYAANWTRSFLTPLLTNPNFNTPGTLIVVTFDENETYTIKNNVWTLLLGNAVPPALRNTTDATFYTHYSQLATCESNWGLYSLGRGDATPPYNNVFSWVASAAKWTNANVTANQIPYDNFTASGYFDTANPAPIPAVITNYTGPGGKGILPSLKGVNGSAINPPSSSSSASASGSGSAAASKSAAVHQFTFSYKGLVGILCTTVAFSVGLLVLA
jgi:acid phosphatase